MLFICAAELINVRKAYGGSDLLDGDTLSRQIAGTGHPCFGDQSEGGRAKLLRKKLS